jgi:hypothetical protein
MVQDLSSVPGALEKYLDQRRDKEAEESPIQHKDMRLPESPLALVALATLRSWVAGAARIALVDSEFCTRSFP